MGREAWVERHGFLTAPLSQRFSPPPCSCALESDMECVLATAGLEDIAQTIENPFRQAWHCLPIDGICAAIRNNLLEIEGRHVGEAGSSASKPSFEASQV